MQNAILFPSEHNFFLQFQFYFIFMRFTNYHHYNIISIFISFKFSLYYLYLCSAQGRYVIDKRNE